MDAAMIVMSSLEILCPKFLSFWVKHLTWTESESESESEAGISDMSGETQKIQLLSYNGALRHLSFLFLGISYEKSLGTTI